MKLPTLNRVLISIMLSAFTTTALAGTQNHREALFSCVEAIEKKLSMDEFDRIDPGYGVKHIRRDLYVFYFNIELRDSEQAPVRNTRVACKSSGYAQVRKISSSSGIWVFAGQDDSSATIVMQ